MKATLLSRRSAMRRQHPLAYSSSSGETRPSSSSESPAEDKCAVCYAGERNCAMVPCGHTFCKECVDKMARCPLCRTVKQSSLVIYKS